MPTTALPSVTSDANGVATINIIPEGAWRWIVSQITTDAPNAPIGSTCKIKFGGSTIVPFMVPTGDVASGIPPLDIPAGGRASIEWTSLGPGVVCRATIIYEQARSRGF
jgi:hypothetical protein